jgi:hypothetical protein
MLTVSVVQINIVQPRPSPRPVETRRIYADVGRRPVIESVFRTPVAAGDPTAEPRVLLGDEVTIRGRNLAGLRTWVRLGALEPILALPEQGGQRIRIALPDATYPIDAERPVAEPIPAERRLRTGSVAVVALVEHELDSVQGGRDDLGAPAPPADRRRRLFSNAGFVQLLPEVAAVSPTSGTAGTTLTVTGKRLFAQGVATVVLVGDAATEAHRVALDPGKPWLPPPDDRVELPLAMLASSLPTPPAGGTLYPVRAIVNGALSPPPAAPVQFRLLP